MSWEDIGLFSPLFSLKIHTYSNLRRYKHGLKEAAFILVLFGISIFCAIVWKSEIFTDIQLGF